MEREIRYYTDEVHDDFAGTHIAPRPLTKKFKYHTRNPLVAVRRFIMYRLVATPVIYFYSAFIRRIKYVNKKCMKGYRRRGCFLYGNHTSFLCDAFNPTRLSFPRPAKVIVGEDATSIRGIRWLLMDLGALPIPSDIHLMGAFTGEIEL